MPDSKGKIIIEPINYLFLVSASNKSTAVNKLNHALESSGITDKFSGKKYHSGNYSAYIDGIQYPQLKNKNNIDATYSNNYWLDQNDHARIFGPKKADADSQDQYIFVASVSEESGGNLKIKSGHYFVSFSNARNNWAIALIQNGYATYYALANNQINTLSISTEDHDGNIYVTIIP